MSRPDNRDPAAVWKSFEDAFDNEDWPSVEWALGDDWATEFDPDLTADQYCALATACMVRLYGDKPKPPELAKDEYLQKIANLAGSHHGMLNTYEVGLIKQWALDGLEAKA